MQGLVMLKIKVSGVHIQENTTGKQQKECVNEGAATERNGADADDGDVEDGEPVGAGKPWAQQQQR